MLASQNTAQNVSSGWNTLYYSSSCSITSGTWYWIGWIVKDASTVSFTLGTPNAGKYKLETFSTFSFASDPGSLSTQTTYYGDYVGYGTAVTDVTVQPPAATASAAAVSPTVTAAINVTVQPPAGLVTSECLTPVIFVGTEISAPVMAATAAGVVCSIAYDYTVSAALGSATGEALAPQVILFEGVLVSAPVMVAAAVFNVPLIILSPIHVIIDGRYIVVTPAVNRVYVIGQDEYGNPVFGSSSDSDEITLVGERLDFHQETSVPTDDEAADVAAAMLAKRRLSKRSGYIVIPPNCGQELWDVIRLYDFPTAQDSHSYRIVGIRFEYVRKGTKPKLTHKLFLGAR